MRRAEAILLGCLMLSVSGCAEGLPMAPVRGTVTLDGEPLTVTPPLGSGTVTFVPTNAENPYAYGNIGPDGSFEMETPDYGKGAALGAYRVMISAGELDSDSPEATMHRLAPRRYSNDQTSGLTATVDEGENVIDFELESNGNPGHR